MTAIYGYYDHSEDLCFLCADDIEFHSQARTDKLMTVEDRFVCAIYGSTVTEDILGLMNYFHEYSSQPKLSNVSDFITRFADVTKSYVPQIIKTWKKMVSDQNMSQQRYNDIFTQGCQVVVCDKIENTLYNLEFGSFDQQGTFKLSKLIVQPLLEKVVHKFALSHNLNVVRTIPQNGTEKEFIQFFSDVVQDHKQLNNHIGNLGTLYSGFKGSHNLYSVFSSFDEFIFEHSKKWIS